MPRDLVKQRKDRELLKRAAARTANHSPTPPLLKQGSKRLKRAAWDNRRRRILGTRNKVIHS